MSGMYQNVNLFMRFFLFIMLCCGMQTAYTQTIFSETFDEANGSTTGNDNTGGVSWSSTCSACLSGDHYEVQSGQLEGQDTNGPAVWQTGNIDISTCSYIEVAFDITSVGTMEACGTGCNAVDWVMLEYNIDGSGWQTPDNSFFCSGACADVNVVQADDVTGGTITYSTGCMNGGNSVQIRITVQTWAADEYWRIDNVTLSCSSGPDADAGNDISICNGSSVTLNGSGTGTPDWSPSSGLNFTDIFNPVASPSSTTTYTLTVTSGACTASDDVMVTIIPVNPITITPDETICAGDCSNLTVSGADYYAWDPNADMTDLTQANQTVCPATTTTYQVTAFTAGTNLIVNGDFEAGNSGFNSSYSFTNPTNFGEAEYNVIPNPQTYNGGFSPCADHTTGAGNMLVVNGSAVVGSTVWCQDVTVQPNTDYLFSAWLTSVHPVNPAELQFTINGVSIGAGLNATATTCDWQQFFSTWNSGASTTATICITNLNTNVMGNDFALDDISFTPVCEQTASVTITVTGSPVVNAESDVEACDGETVSLNTLSSTPGGATITWTNSQTSIGLAASGSGNIPSFTAINTGSSPVTATITVTATAGSCTSPDEVFTITVNPTPSVNAGIDQSVCEGDLVTLTATNPDGATLSWDNGITDNVAFVPSVGTTTYTVTATFASTGCAATDAVNVTVSAMPNVLINPAGPFNTTSGVQNITASPSGGTWSADCGACINATTGAFNPALAGTGTWEICYTAGTSPCIDSDCINIVVTNDCALSATILSNNPTCYQFNDGSVSINVTGASGTADYVITNSSGTVVNTGNSNAANNLVEGWYYFEVTDDLGCVLIDSVEINHPEQMVIQMSIVQPPCYGIANGAVYIDTILNYTGAYSQIGYFWNPNPSGTNGLGADTLENLDEGQYNLVINDQNGCSVSLDFDIVFPDSLYLVEFGYEPAYCRRFWYQSGNGVVYASASGGTPDYEYLWTNLETGVNASSSTWGGLNPGTYQITVTDDNGCILQQNIEVDSLNPVADFDLTSPQLSGLFEGNAVVYVHLENQSTNYSNPIDPFTDTTFFWHFGFDEEPWVLSTNINETFDIAYSQAGVYEICLAAYNNNGCADTSCMTITVYDAFTFTPVNIFTPDGDGANDVFTFNDLAKSVELFTCVIVDRWGVVMYEMNSIADAWDGTDKQGNKCSDGVYFYTYELVSFNGIEQSGQGTIQLIGEK